MEDPGTEAGKTDNNAEVKQDADKGPTDKWGVG